MKKQKKHRPVDYIFYNDPLLHYLRINEDDVAILMKEAEKYYKENEDGGVA